MTKEIEEKIIKAIDVKSDLYAEGRDRATEAKKAFTDGATFGLSLGEAELREAARLKKQNAELVEALSLIQRHLEQLISATPSGELRNKITEENILAFAALIKAKG